MTRLLWPCIFMNWSCGDNQGESAQVGVVLKPNAVESSLSLNTTEEFVIPDVLQFRPLAVRISVDNQGGYMVWGAKDCPGEEGAITIDEKEYKYFSEHTCVLSQENAWINLLDGEEGLNTEFNSQSWPIPPGDYGYVSIIMCHKDDTNQRIGEGTATVQYKADVMPQAKDQQICNPFSGTMATPISIDEGGSLKIQVEFNPYELLRVGTFDVPWEYNESADSGDSHYVCDDDNVCTYAVSPQFGVDALTPSLAQ